MKSRIQFALVALLVLGSTGLSQQPRYYPFESHADYREKIHVLNGFVTRYGRSRINHIYVAPGTPDDAVDGRVHLFGYWPEEHRILFVDTFIRTFDGRRETTDYLWLNSRHGQVNLRIDVVPTKEDIHGSTFLVDKPWADEIVSMCVARGRKIIVRKRR
jgi:hypothetical protein